jgi:hypothetical protein
MEIAYLAIAGTVIAVAAIYFVWVRKLGTTDKQPPSAARPHEVQH